MSARFVSTRVEGRTLVVTIERPEVLNALHAPAQAELAAAFDAFAADPALWVAILTGAGARAFCAGADLKARAADGPVDLPASGFAGLTRRFDLDKPLVAAVNGLAYGGGFEAALACDVVIAGAHARFALPEPRIGTAALAGGLLRLPRAIGLKRAMPMMLTGRAADAAEGLRSGFVSEVVAPGQELPRALAFAVEIAACGPAAVRAAKQVATRGAELPLAEALAAQGEWPAVASMRASPDHAEGPRAFVEKRPPRWTA